MHILRLIISILACLFIITSFSIGQTGFIMGTVKDAKSYETLLGANITNSENNGTVTDYSGNYSFNVKLIDTLMFSFLGYNDVVKYIKILENDTLIVNVILQPKSEELHEIVISESKYEQKLSEVTVSMEIIRPEMLENSNDIDLENLIKRIAGVEVMDGQPSIRGGSGYSYGAGSRVLLLMNDLPLMSADAGDVKWNFLPLENISQIEIIKGASSVLYGSSALNGVINFRTSYAKSNPITKTSLMYGGYLKPKRKETIWWDKPRTFYGINYFHSQKINNSDIVIGADFYSDRGYRENEFEKRSRFNINYQHKDEKVKGLIYGLNSNVMDMDKIDFFLWQDADSGIYRQDPSVVSQLSGIRATIDPFVNYYSKKGIKHSLKLRYFYVDNSFKNDSSKNSLAQSLFIDYQFLKKFKNNFNLVAGISNKTSNIKAELYNNHKSNELSMYAQADKMLFSRLKLLIGVRLEQYYLNEKKEEFQPILRSGLNYKLLEHTHLRASFGQGYRYPSIAEKYTATTVGPLNILPNPELKPEKGWSAETGIMQNFKINNFLMVFDLAGFITRYKNMMEFKFDLHLPPGESPNFNYLGFKALNVNNTRISGVDINMKGKADFGNLSIQFQTGFTATKPIDLDYSNNSIKRGEILKYRHLNIFKSDLELSYKKITLGADFSHHSKMINIDSVFIEPIIGSIMILPGFDEYWQNKNKAYSILNLRIVFKVTTRSTFSINLKNALNKEYMIRPGDISAPRNFSVKYSLKI